MINIVKRKPEAENEYALVAYEMSGSPEIDVYSYDPKYGVEPYAYLTEIVPGVIRDEDKVVINHDLITTDPELLSAIIGELASSQRDVMFGPFNTKTKVIRLKDDWRKYVLIDG